MDPGGIGPKTETECLQKLLMKLERGLAVNQAGLRPAVWSEHRLILENKSTATTVALLFLSFSVKQHHICF